MKKKFPELRFVVLGFVSSVFHLHSCHSFFRFFQVFVILCGLVFLCFCVVVVCVFSGDGVEFARTHVNKQTHARPHAHSHGTHGVVPELEGSVHDAVGGVAV